MSILPDALRPVDSASPVDHHQHTRAELDEALFLALLHGEHPSTPEQIRAAAEAELSACGCSHVCECVALEFGDHPDTAPDRMHRAHDLIELAYPGRAWSLPQQRGGA